MPGELEHAVRTFFEEARVAGLLLPSGWFGGRAMENHHRLTSVVQEPMRLLIELDERLVLTFSGPVRVKTRNTVFALAGGTPTLVVDGFEQCMFDWHEYDSDTPHADIFHDGCVCFVAPE